MNMNKKKSIKRRNNKKALIYHMSVFGIKFNALKRTAWEMQNTKIREYEQEGEMVRRNHKLLWR